MGLYKYNIRVRKFINFKCHAIIRNFVKTHCRWSQTDRGCDDICVSYRQIQRCNSQTMILKHCLNRTNSRIFILPISDSIHNPKSIDRILHRARQSICQLYFHFKSQFPVPSTITHACQWKTLHISKHINHAMCWHNSYEQAPVNIVMLHLNIYS